jgi:hypothetical protein
MVGGMCMMYADYSLPKEQRKLNYIGFKKPHPLEKYIIFSIQGKNDNIDELINDVIKTGCLEIIKMLNKIQNELEGTHQFINELKKDLLVIIKGAIIKKTDYHNINHFQLCIQNNNATIEFKYLFISVIFLKLYN